MNLQHLRYVAEVERTGSITKAAKNLYMGQPNLSKAIRELENETGITIFRRTRQGVESTEMGAQFLAYAHTILSQMDELESLYKPQIEREFKFSVSVPRSTYITAAFTQFLSTVPDTVPMNVNFKETSSMGALNDVVDGESQLAVIRFQSIYEDYFLNFIKSMKLRHELLWEYKMCLLMSAEHPLASANDIPYHQLDGYTEIVHGDLQVPSLSFAQISRNAQMKANKRRIHIYERGSQYDILRRVRGTYMWVSPIPYEILAQNELVTKECPAASMSNKDLLVIKDDHTMTADEKQFIGLVKKYAGSILP